MSATVLNVMVKPFHFSDIYDLYNTGGELNSDNDYDIDITTEKAATTTAQNLTVDALETTIDGQKTSTIAAIDALIQALIDTPPEDEAAWITAMGALQTAQASAINTGIAPNYTQLKTDLATDLNAEISNDITGSKAAIALAMQVDYNAAVQANSLTFICPQCGTIGRNPTFNEDGSPTGVYVESDVCNGLGYTDVQWQRDPNSNGFIPVP